MSKRNQHWLKSRRIFERIVVEGDLELLTPAHFGSGDTEGPADLSLLRDACDGAALLPGASIAGALRNYWREWRGGYGALAQHSDLFGAKRGARREEMDGEQSLLIVEDAFGPRSKPDASYPKPQVELRDGVRIDGQTRTAAEGKLFDMELLRAGTRFRLRFELLINEQKPKKMSWAAYDRLPQNERDVLLDKRRKELYTDLAVALQGFERGEIGLGARKRRGFGRCQVSKWQMRRYDLTTPEGLLAWLSEGRAWQECPMVLVEEGNSLAEILGVSLHDTKDKRHRFEIEARFALDGSLQVRSGFGQADQGPDMEHLHRPLYDESDPSGVKREPVLPGTSLAGVLRARAVRIANTLTDDEVKAQTLVSKLFGVGPEDVEGKGQDEKALQASRLVVHEVVVRGARPLVQTRIRVDRFTGGAMDNFLFNEAPVFGGEDSRLTLELTVRDPRDYEIGLLLLLLKDLWTGDLPVGGESSVGRGRLKGKSADLIHVQEGETTTWQITQGEDRLEVASRPEPDDVWQSLETYVQALNEHLAGR